MLCPMAMSGRILIQEVVTRDGFQNEPEWIPTSDKIALINALSHSGGARRRNR